MLVDSWSFGSFLKSSQLFQGDYTNYCSFFRPYNHYRIRVDIRRTHIFEDAYTYLSGLKEELKDRIAISFIDQHNLTEAGVDGGGLLKEFLTL